MTHNIRGNGFAFHISISNKFLGHLPCPTSPSIAFRVNYHGGSNYRIDKSQYDPASELIAVYFCRKDTASIMFFLHNRGTLCS
jgi:hypothetical protein